MDDFITSLQKNFPGVTFSKGKSFCWSPATHEIIYNPDNFTEPGIWAVLHELGHSLLGHTNYTSDFGLLRLEVSAWQKAEELSKNYSQTIDKEHIQNCLDTYRDWLHRRSKCPSCNNISLQYDSHHYKCFNCHTIWKVSTSRFCRPYRQLAHHKEKSPTHKEQATFS